MEQNQCAARVLHRLNRILGHICSQEEKQTDLTFSRVSAILDEERKNGSFDVEKLTNFLNGGELYTQLNDIIASRIEQDEVLNDNNEIWNMSRPELRINTMRKIKRVVEMWDDAKKDSSHLKPPKKEKDESEFDMGQALADAFWRIMSLYDSNWATRIGVHFGLFKGAIEGQGTDEQKAYYLPLIQNMNIIGCFSMTELGHGSYVRGIETTATYDKSTEEFVIHSPTDTATKWWIGMAGQTATHTVVYAKLLIDGKDHGVHSFVVQIRSLDDGTPLKGIKIGDCGAKMGRNGLDNGWIQFDNLRIPRKNMLMRWSQVSPQGEFTKPPRAQMSYGALLHGRVAIIRDASDNAKKAVTVAIRYGANRRQFTTDNINEEEQVLNYSTHQYRLIPLLAQTYATHFTAVQMEEQFKVLMKELNSSNLNSLKVVHSTSAGLKAFFTWWCIDSIELARQCCGGHGYSAYSAFPSSHADYAVNCTWEGDNTVLAQQTARFLIKSLHKVKSGERLDGFAKYIEDPSILNSVLNAKSVDQLLDLNVQLNAHKWLAFWLLSRTDAKMKMEKGTKSQVWNTCMVDLVTTAKAHCYYYVLHCFIEAIYKCEDKQTKAILKKLCDLFALHNIELNLRWYLQGGFISAAQGDLITEAVRSLCRSIRREAVPLVDAFNLPDFLLRTPLGRKDGNIYQHYFELVKKAPENKNQVPPYYDELIKPLIQKQ
eukprot:TRINITY_DN4675_c0_g1_i1.p1 TRINITY_DN4675_c0_g1~~TRINITY_DN4675_c0_g1_i1.p1  ORF type:complete len:721 (+),score=132.72 TRINITY_DN4675_c0_g1_i1:28-2163(+)